MVAHEFTFISVCNLKAVVLVCVALPDQGALAEPGGPGEQSQGTAPQEAAPADPGSAQDAAAEPRLGTCGAHAAAGPAGEAAGVPQHREERYTSTLEEWEKEKTIKALQKTKTLMFVFGFFYCCKASGAKAVPCVLHYAWVDSFYPPPAVLFNSCTNGIKACQ